MTTTTAFEVGVADVADGDDVADYLLENMQMSSERANSVNHRIEWVVYSTGPVMIHQIQGVLSSPSLALKLSSEEKNLICIF